MVVQHNMQAMNANRMLNVTTSAQSKSTEKLSSGYRINRAADDAAGLTISEKMRKQIKGLDRASTNAQDGVSAVQTAEGALTEVHSMLQRMNELATQSANGTNSTTDRKAIQDEIDQLTTEIDRVSETTKFNETYLLQGDENGGKTQNTIKAHDAGLAGKLTGAGTGSATFTANALANGSKVTIAGKEYTIDTAAATNPSIEGLTDAEAAAFGKETGATAATKAKTEIDLTGWKANDTIKVDGTEYKNDAGANANIGDIVTAINTKFTADGKAFTASANGNKLVIEANDAGQKTAIAITDGTVNGATKAATTTNGADAARGTYTAYTTADDLKTDLAAGNDIYLGNLNTKVDTSLSDKINVADAYKLMAKELETASNIGVDDDKKATVTNNNNGTFTITEGKAETAAKLSFSLHVGADADMTNKINVDIESMSAAGLGIKGLNVEDATGKSATYAIDAIADAISKVSEQRSALGAVQNRLEHTISNVDNVVENTTTAESRIRDTDMAEEMVNYSKNNILAQAGQSMLAQANQANQGVLSLLQ
nr:flagellin [uncultured Agathobacter sp.]